LCITYARVCADTSEWEWDEWQLPEGGEGGEAGGTEPGRGPGGEGGEGGEGGGGRRHGSFASTQERLARSPMRGCALVALAQGTIEDDAEGLLQVGR
jgi:hypothetical protein